MLLFFNIRSAMVSKKYLEIVKKQAETAAGGLLLPLAALLLLPHARRWDALATVAPLLLPSSGGGFIWWLHYGDVGGDSSSSDTPGGGFIWRLPLSLLWLQWWMPSRQRGELVWTTSRFQLFSIIIKHIHSFSHFQIQKLESKLALAQKELQQARKENQAPTRYINTRRKKEEVRRKEEARKKVEEEA
jgi:hypothetical protein